MTLTNDRIFVLWDVESARAVDHIASDSPYSLQHLAQDWTRKYRRKFTVKTLAEVFALVRQSKSTAGSPPVTEPKEVA